MHTLNTMFEYLARVLSSNGVYIEVERVTSEMIKEAENNRLKNKKDIKVLQ